MLKMTNVHECLTRSALGVEVSEPMENVTTRIKPSDVSLARYVCTNHGTDLSSYIRECVVSLLDDYRDTKPVE
jgi:hypothetical protein